MNDQLIPVFSGELAGQPAQLCDARELHAFMEVKSRFNDWIASRIDEYGFEEVADYYSISSNRADGKPGKGRTDYHLSLDMAKELAMVERNDKGRMARRYFIECERRLQGGATIGLVHKNASSIFLWFERGAARHAKILDTDEAWEVFEKLEDAYFHRNDKPKAVLPPVNKPLSLAEAGSLLSQSITITMTLAELAQFKAQAAIQPGQASSGVERSYNTAPRRKGHNYWRPDEDQVVKDGVLAGEDKEAIAAKLPGRTVDAVKQRIALLRRDGDLPPTGGATCA